MNIVSVDLVGAVLPLVVTAAYLPRTVRAMRWAEAGLFVLAVLLGVKWSYCDARAVHVFPGAIVLSIVVWLRRVQGKGVDLPAAAIFALTFASMLPVDAYLGFTCKAGDGTARMGGGGIVDGLLLAPMILACLHSIIYYACERDERGKGALRDFLKRQFAIAR